MGSQTMSLTHYSTVSRPEEAVDPRVSDFDAFYASWYPRAVAIAQRKGLKDPEAAAQEVMMVCWRTDYLQRQPDSKFTFDRFVANLIYRRLISMQRKELRRRDIAPMEAIGARDFESGGSPYVDFKERLAAATDLIRDVHPEFYGLWKGVVYQVLVGRATAGWKVDQSELARRVQMSQAQLEKELDRFISVAAEDHELADLLGVDRA